MKAVVFREYGSPDVLKLEERSKPTPKGNEVLIRVYAASVNSWDHELLRGTPFVNRMLFGLFKPKIRILGVDIAGRIEAVGSGVKEFQPGDEVFGDISGRGWGGFAEYVCPRADVLALKSASMSFEEAAAIPQAGVLALQGLRHNGEVKEGQKILVNGGGGGVGTFAVQMAKARAATVTGVDHPNKLDMMRSVGFDQVIDCTKEDFAETGQGYDLILDVVGRRSIFEYKRLLNPGGAYAMIGGPMPRIFQVATLGPLISRVSGKKLGLLLHHPNRKDLMAINKLYEKGKVKPVIHRCYPLSGVPDAIRDLGNGQVNGKAVITIQEE